MEKIGTPADWQVVGPVSPKLFKLKWRQNPNLTRGYSWFRLHEVRNLKIRVQGRAGRGGIYLLPKLSMCMYITITRSWQGFWPETQKYLANEQFTRSVYIYIHKHKQRYPFTSARSQNFAFNYSVYILPMKIRLFCIVFRKIDVKSCVNW